MRSIDESLGIFLEEVSVPGPENDLWHIKRDNQEAELANNLGEQPSAIRMYSGHIGVCQKGRPDFTVIRFEKAVAAAAIFTTNKCVADSIPFNRANIAKGKIQLLCVISKNANVFTPHGEEHTHMLAEALAKEFSVDAKEILISCTGVIGRELPIQKILHGISGLSSALQKKQLEKSAQAIMTTDRKEKYASVRFGEHIISGIAKGAGMIEPNMATMLSYIFTSVDLTSEELNKALREAADKSFHSMSVDSDTSTSDTLAIFATGETQLSGAEKEFFLSALTALCMKLARDIVGQGEGVKTVIEAEVALDTSEKDARIIAKQIINSPLIKTAVHGADPNWGRIVMAIGKPSPALELKEIPRDQLRIEIMEHCVFDGGAEVPVNLQAISQLMKNAKTVSISVKIGQGKYCSRVWGADLSREYIDINADYTT